MKQHDYNKELNRMDKKAKIAKSYQEYLYCLEEDLRKSNDIITITELKKEIADMEKGLGKLHIHVDVPNPKQKSLNIRK